MNDFLRSPVFAGLPSLKSLVFVREQTPKILRFDVTDENAPLRPLYLATIIDREEKLAWQSFQDVLDHTKKMAEKLVRGFLGLHVLSLELGAGMQHFNPAELSQLIVNHARVLGPDQKTLIRYGQLFALLHYRAPAEWGKIEVKTYVDFVNQEPMLKEISEADVREALLGRGKKKSRDEQVDHFFKKILKDCGKEAGAIYLIHDLSAHSIWNPANQAQQERVREVIQKDQKTRGGIRPEMYYSHAGSMKTIPG